MSLLEANKSTLEFPRDDLVRMSDPCELRSEGDGRTMVGYPIVFNRWTEISSWEGNFLERIAPGAVKKTLRERGSQVKILFNHGADPQIGNKPLGVPDVMREDANGLYTEVPLADTSYNRDLVELMKADSKGRSALAGMSFRFQVVQETIDEEPKRSTENPKGLPERTVTELRLYEFGPVTFPAYEAAQFGLRARWRELDDEQAARIVEQIQRPTRDDMPEAPDAASGTSDTDIPAEPAPSTPRSLTTSQHLKAALALRGL